MSIRSRAQIRGFTLIELVIVIAIVGILLSIGAKMFYRSHSSQTLRETSEEIELLAKRARAKSMLKQIPYALSFNKERAEILISAQAEHQNPSQVAEKVNDSQKVFYFDPELSVFIRHFNSQEWLPLEKDKNFTWVFDPQGLCEPISIKFAIESSYIIHTFHPLTAAIADTESEIH